MRARQLAGAGIVCAVLLFGMAGSLASQPNASAQPAERQKRVETVLKVPGLVALWDFVLREPDGKRRFLAHTPGGAAFPLDAENYVRTYWNEGREATYADFPLLGRGPFGEGVQFRAEEDPHFRPTLLAPRETIHDTGLDVKGPGASVSMLVWTIRQAGNHALAGIWHEGTDLRERGMAATKVQAGRRQYALFAGLGANNGASAVHVSENGRSSFGDKYARNLATTLRLLPTAPPGSSAEQLDAAWSVSGFVFDNARNMVTAYLNGEAEDYWIENPASHPFFRWPAKGWLQAKLHRMPGLQEGEEPDFPQDQFYEPPERKPRQRRRVSASGEERVWEDTCEFTRVRVTERRGADGRWQPVSWELLALRVNPYWFGHDLYHPKTPEEGGPFTIGRVIHSSRSVGMTGFIGGVAVYNRALSAAEMRKLSAIGFEGKGDSRRPSLLSLADTEGR